MDFTRHCTSSWFSLSLHCVSFCSMISGLILASRVIKTHHRLLKCPTLLIIGTANCSSVRTGGGEWGGGQRREERTEGLKHTKNTHLIFVVVSEQKLHHLKWQCELKAEKDYLVNLVFLIHLKFVSFSINVKMFQWVAGHKVTSQWRYVLSFNNVFLKLTSVKKVSLLLQISYRTALWSLIKHFKSQ